MVDHGWCLVDGEIDGEIGWNGWLTGYFRFHQFALGFVSEVLCCFMWNCQRDDEYDPIRSDPVDVNDSRESEKHTPW